jgi:hypothetical protein
VGGRAGRHDAQHREHLRQPLARDLRCQPAHARRPRRPPPWCLCPHSLAPSLLLSFAPSLLPLPNGDSDARSPGRLLINLERSLSDTLTPHHLKSHPSLDPKPQTLTGMGRYATRHLAGHLINVGVTLRMVRAQQLWQLARRLRTSGAALRLLNPDVTDDAWALQPFDRLCVLPAMCGQDCGGAAVPFPLPCVRVRCMGGALVRQAQWARCSEAPARCAAPDRPEPSDHCTNAGL